MRPYIELPLKPLWETFHIRGFQRRRSGVVCRPEPPPPATAAFMLQENKSRNALKWDQTEEKGGERL